MRKLILVAATAAALVPAGAATAKPKAQTPKQTCHALRESMGVDGFRAAYGTNHNHRNAMGKCVSAERHAAHPAHPAHPVHPAHSHKHA